MKERPIIFNTEMVRAILDGRKTMTRRPVKPQPESVDEKNHTTIPYNGSAEFLLKKLKCPLGKVGDKLYVRETFNGGTDGIPIAYKASNPELNGIPWTPSIHMPKVVARIWLEITDIKIEKVQDITNKDAIKEGVLNMYDPSGKSDWSLGFAIACFKKLWDSIYKNWNDNPWVWIIEFKKIEVIK